MFSSDKITQTEHLYLLADKQDAVIGLFSTLFFRIGGFKPFCYVREYLPLLPEREFSSYYFRCKHTAFSCFFTRFLPFFSNAKIRGRYLHLFANTFYLKGRSAQVYSSYGRILYGRFFNIPIKLKTLEKLFYWDNKQKKSQLCSRFI